MTSWIDRQIAVASIQSKEADYETRRESIRKLLRQGGYKPSGRNKPAQEYLLRCLREDGVLPTILPPVDILNALSVRMGLPISMLRKEAFPSVPVVRLGLQGESYVFNSAQQELNLEGLVVICGGESSSVPMGSPIKDSLNGKITPGDQGVIAFIYGAADNVNLGEIAGYARELGEALVEHTSAKSLSWGAIDHSQCAFQTGGTNVS